MKKRPPAKRTSHALPGPDNVLRVELDNGVTVLVRENHSAPMVALDGFCPAGSIHDPEGRAGLSSFVARMVTRGSAQYDFATFNGLIESVGASLTVGGDTHNANVSVQCLAEDFPLLVAILADALRRPVFAEEQVELVRQQKLVSLQERAEDPQQMSSLRFYEAIYGAHPYGRPVSGYADTVLAITRDDLVQFHAARYTPRGAIVAISGDVQAEATVALIQRHFGDWQGAAPDQRVPPPSFSNTPQRLRVPMPGKFQADIVIGCPAVARLHPDYYAVRVANTILGQFGMMGRLGESVREEQGLAYYSYSTQDAELHAGVWLASAGVHPEAVDQAAESILAEFARLGDEPAPDDELADSQAYMTGVLPLMLETNEGVASTLLHMEWYGLGLDYLHRYPDLIFGVTPADVQRVAKRYLGAGNQTLVVAGPLE